MSIHRRPTSPFSPPFCPRRVWTLIAILGAISAASPVAAGELKGADEIVRALSGSAAPSPDRPPALRFRGIHPRPKPDAARPVGRIDLTVHFATDSATILPGSKVQVREIAEAAKRLDLGSSRLLIVGHTDSRGPADYNLRLSQRRAQAVERALVAEHGVPADDLLVEGRGETEPLVDPERNPADLAKNRRVELRLVERSETPR